MTARKKVFGIALLIFGVVGFVLAILWFLFAIPLSGFGGSDAKGLVIVLGAVGMLASAGLIGAGVWRLRLHSDSPTGQVKSKCQL